jgi:putative tryptophan/tyrosine transport system substrate-binding protein
VTGLFLDQATLAGKWVGLLKEALPGLKRITLVWDPTTGSDQLDAAKAAARSEGVETKSILEVRKSEDLEAALAMLKGQTGTGIIQLGSPILVNPPNRFAEAALRAKLPSVSFFKPIAKAGGLMTYGANLKTYYPRAILMAMKSKGDCTKSKPRSGPGACRWSEYGFCYIFNPEGSTAAWLDAVSIANQIGWWFGSNIRGNAE